MLRISCSTTDKIQTLSDDILLCSFEYNCHLKKKTIIKFFIIYCIRTVVFIFIVIFTTFRPMYPLAFFKCFTSNEGVYTKLCGARSEMVIVVRKWIRRHVFKSWTRLIAFNIVLTPWEICKSDYSPSSYE